MDNAYVYKVLQEKAVDVEVLSKAFHHISWHGLSENTLNNLQPREKTELLKLIPPEPKKKAKK